MPASCRFSQIFPAFPRFLNYFPRMFYAGGSDQGRFSAQSGLSWAMVSRYLPQEGPRQPQNGPQEAPNGPKMARAGLPEVAKMYKNLWFFDVFCLAAFSATNRFGCPKIAAHGTKMAPKGGKLGPRRHRFAQSCSERGPSYP